MGSKKGTDFSIYRRLLLEVRPFWIRLILLLLISLLSTPLALLTPLPLKIVIGNALGSKPLSDFIHTFLPIISSDSPGSILTLALGLMLVVAVLVVLLNANNSILKASTEERMAMALRTRLFRHIQDLSLSFHDPWGTADSLC